MRLEFEAASNDEAFETVKLRVQARQGEVREIILRAMRRAMREAFTIMRGAIPYDEGEAYRSIDTGPIRYMPGGAGGGGFYEAELTVGEGVEHMQFITEGTGIYGPRGDFIYPKNRGFLTFQKKGEERKFVGHVKGQKPQTEWLIAAQQRANEVIEDAVRRIDAMD